MASATSSRSRVEGTRATRGAHPRQSAASSRWISATAPATRSRFAGTFNQLLAPEERQAAAAISKALSAGAEAHHAGRDAAAEASRVLAREPLVKPQYVQVARFDGRLVLAAAARVGAVRLIDNVVLEGDRA